MSFRLIQRAIWLLVCSSALLVACSTSDKQSPSRSSIEPETPTNGLPAPKEFDVGDRTDSLLPKTGRLTDQILAINEENCVSDANCPDGSACVALSATRTICSSGAAKQAASDRPNPPAGLLNGSVRGK